MFIATYTRHGIRPMYHDLYIHHYIKTPPRSVISNLILLYPLSFRYFKDVIVPDSITPGKNVLIASSENAIRGLLMHLCDIPEERIHKVGDAEERIVVLTFRFLWLLVQYYGATITRLLTCILRAYVKQ